MANAREQFRVDPLVVFKLGEELISDEIQALLELIKNAYDADASYVVVNINTEGTPDGIVLPPISDRAGYIEVIDDGTGMDLSAIRNGWLLIARSAKRDFKREGRVTKKNRTPLGDKGLGRLGAQRLGDGLQIATKTEQASEELVVAFSWMDFYTAAALDDVDVRRSTRPSGRKRGTTLTITELKEAERWRGDGVRDLQRELSQVISPYEGVSGFTVTVTVDGAAVDLQSLNQQVRETAQLHYDIDFDGEKLTMRGKATLALFRPSNKAQLQPFSDLVEADSGAQYFRHLKASNGAADFKFRRAKGKWFLTFERTRQLTDIVAADGGDDATGADEPANPGPFRSEVDSFDLAPGDDDRLEVFGGLKPYREFIKDLSGIRVYRDGFAVRVDEDWLRLGAQWSGAGSYYGLKPSTTTGYVALTSRDNPRLIEKTDREGFTDNVEYRTFFALMQQFTAFTGEAQQKLRREFTAFLKQHLTADADVPPGSSAEAVSEQVTETLKETEEVRKDVAEAQQTVARAADAAQAVATYDPGDESDEAAERLEAAATLLQDAMSQAERTFSRLDTFLANLGSVEAKAKLVREEFLELRDQLAQGVEAMSLGLTAEALSHEMFNIADTLATRTQAMMRDLNAGKTTGRATRQYVEYVRGTVGSLRKELSHFSPSLRYVRDRREEIDMRSFAEDVVEYYGARFDDRGIKFTVHDASTVPFVVRGSRGKLTQVFDNLLLNSSYWLAHSGKRRRGGEVGVRLHRPLVTISDTGPGVEPSVEETLFDPFVTRKPRGTGRGLGLFIVRQLLEADGCSIALGPRRNAKGRRHEFVLNLGGILHDG